MKLTLAEKRDEAKGTKTFFWKSDKKINYLPGQFFYYTLPKLNYPDQRGATRQFTISSSPTEGPFIASTTRIREGSGFKQTLNELKIGDSVEGDGPNGTFILNNNEEGTQVFIAGGIGITPFRSMARYATDKKLKIPIYLIYSNSLPEEITFKDDFEEFEMINPYFKHVLTVTKPEESKIKWNGQTGRVDGKLINSLIGNWKLNIENCTFWVCGPPPMVDAIEQTMEDMKVGVGNIRSEKFTGY